MRPANAPSGRKARMFDPRSLFGFRGNTTATKQRDCSQNAFTARFTAIGLSIEMHRRRSRATTNVTEASSPHDDRANHDSQHNNSREPTVVTMHHGLYRRISPFPKAKHVTNDSSACLQRFQGRETLKYSLRQGCEHVVAQAANVLGVERARQATEQRRDSAMQHFPLCQ